MIHVSNMKDAYMNKMTEFLHKKADYSTEHTWSSNKGTQLLCNLDNCCKYSVMHGHNQVSATNTFMGESNSTSSPRIQVEENP